MFFPHALGIETAGTAWPAGVRACMTNRLGGVSQAPFDAFNLGHHVGDAPAAVTENRRHLLAHCGVEAVFMQQVHGTTVQALTSQTPSGVQADACWTDVPGLACTVMVADCLPLLFAAPDGSSVAAVHAGWRGLAGQEGRGVLEALCEAWPAAERSADRRHLSVWLGPCIGPLAFEVGAEVREAFVRHDPQALEEFQPLDASKADWPIGSEAQPKKYLANLAALARRRLQRLGFARIHGNDGTGLWCTVSQPSRFFSHRRDAAILGSTGRMAALIWRVRQ